jgi:4-alpha-glucanotransferase
MDFPRASGILLHPTSLPGRYGIGDLGEYAFRFIDYLKQTGQAYWQVLPLGPTSYGDSPYQALSTFAGNTNLISLDKVAAMGWLSPQELADVPKFPVYAVDYGPVIEYHNRKLALAYKNFAARGKPEHKAAFADWCQSQADWLEDYALFLALKDENGGRPWTEWANKGESLRETEALSEASARLTMEIERVKFGQWLFFSQWHEVRAYANAAGIRIIGDIPIFVAHDSSDVWANRELFSLDENGVPNVVAGVPPDYFSRTGQYWGNPLYKWDLMKSRGYPWWIARMRSILATVDIVRIDHFRGFYDYWEIPVNDERTAVNGRWVDGPNLHFFHALREQLGGDLPIIAEDLGDMHPMVYELRDALDLPGMKIIQFGFDGPTNKFLPHNYESRNFIVYTGTHDNNTARGWWDGEGTEGEKAYFQALMDREITEPHWEMIRLAMASVAHTFVAPLQDILGFGADTRMNMPGKLGGNWTWRFTPEWLNFEPAKMRLIHYTRLYNRWTD